jgi:1,4-dihydroxy-6-naphthoate synthase
MASAWVVKLISFGSEPASAMSGTSRPAAPSVIRLGHSPDPDDAFMFYGLARDLIDTEGLRFVHELQDIETLNQRAKRGELEVTAVSLSAYTELTDKYIILNTGASMGRGYGPMVVAREPFKPALIPSRKIAVPGLHTTAYRTLRMAVGEFPYEVVPFDKIFRAVIDKKVDAGLIIHEGQLTYQDEGFYCILDLGKWWEGKHKGLPLPLGLNVVRRDLGPEMCRRVDRVLRRSIQYSLDHRQQAVEYALQWGRGLSVDKGDRFIAMYVNDLTTDTGGVGRPAIEQWLADAKEAGLIAADVEAEFVPRD